MGWSASAGSGYQNSGGSQQNNNASSSSGNTQSTWVPNPAMDNNYGQANAQLDFLQQTPRGYFPGYTTVGPSKARQEGIGLQMDSMFPMAKEGMQNVYNNAGASQAGYGAANDMYGKAANMAPGVSNAYGNAASAYGAGAGAQAGMLPGANKNFEFLSNAADVANNPYVNAQADAMTRRLNQNFSESLLPQINAGANQVNALGSSRHALAQAQGSERTQEQLSRGLADLYGGAYQSGLGAQQTALGQTGAMLRNQLAPAEALGQAARERQMGMNVMGQGGQYLQQGAQGIQQGNQDYLNNVRGALDLGQTGANTAANAADTVEGYHQRFLNDQVDRYNAQYEEPWNRLNDSASLINGLFGQLGTNYGSSQGMQTGTNTGRNKGSGYNLADEMSVGSKMGS